MIEEIYIDLDDVCNCLGPHVLRYVGCNIGSSDYSRYPGQFGWDTHLAASEKPCRPQALFMTR